MRSESEPRRTIKTNNNKLYYHQKLYIYLKEKLKNKVKIASNKTETDTKIIDFTRKDMGPVHNKTRSQLNIKEQKQQS